MEEVTRQRMAELLAAMTTKERDTPPPQHEMDAWVLVYRDVDDEHGITVRRGIPYWVVQLAVPKTAPDEQGVVTKVDAYVTTGKAALIEGLEIDDEVIIFGEWQTRPPRLSLNTKPKTTNSPVKAWKNLPLKFSLTHPKQIVRVNAR